MMLSKMQIVWKLVTGKDNCEIKAIAAMMPAFKKQPGSPH